MPTEGRPLDKQACLASLRGHISKHPPLGHLSADFPPHSPIASIIYLFYTHRRTRTYTQEAFPPRQRTKARAAAAAAAAAIMAEDEETMGFGEEEEEEVRAPRSRRKTAKYTSGDYVKTDDADFEDEEDEEEDDESRYAARGRGGGGARGARRASAPAPRKKGTKYCPSCEEPVRPSATVCEYCDYVFTSAARHQDDVPVSERFAFEPERVRRCCSSRPLDRSN
jgi:hypothetical protein